MHLSIGFKDQPFSGSLREDFLSALRSEALTSASFGPASKPSFRALPLCDVNIVMRDISLPEVSTASMPFPSPDGGDQRAIAYNRVATFDVAPGQWMEESPSQDEHRTSFTLAERTREDFDVRAFVGRLAASIPTLQNAVISVPRPSRWGGGARTARLCRVGPGAHAVTGDDSDVLYEEVGESLKQVRQRNNKQGWASLSRAWYRGWSLGWTS